MGPDEKMWNWLESELRKACSLQVNVFNLGRGSSLGQLIARLFADQGRPL